MDPVEAAIERRDLAALRAALAHAPVAHTGPDRPLLRALERDFPDGMAVLLEAGSAPPSSTEWALTPHQAAGRSLAAYALLAPFSDHLTHPWQGMGFARTHARGWKALRASVSQASQADLALARPLFPHLIQGLLEHRSRAESSLPTFRLLLERLSEEASPEEKHELQETAVRWALAQSHRELFQWLVKARPTALLRRSGDRFEGVSEALARGWGEDMLAWATTLDAPEVWSAVLGRVARSADLPGLKQGCALHLAAPSARDHDHALRLHVRWASYGLTSDALFAAPGAGPWLRWMASLGVRISSTEAFPFHRLAEGASVQTQSMRRRSWLGAVASRLVAMGASPHAIDDEGVSGLDALAPFVPDWVAAHRAKTLNSSLPASVFRGSGPRQRL